MGPSFMRKHLTSTPCCVCYGVSPGSSSSGSWPNPWNVSSWTCGRPRSDAEGGSTGSSEWSGRCTGGYSTVAPSPRSNRPRGTGMDGACRTWTCSNVGLVLTVGSRVAGRAHATTGPKTSTSILTWWLTYCWNEKKKRVINHQYYSCNKIVTSKHEVVIGLSWDERHGHWGLIQSDGRTPPHPPSFFLPSLLSLTFGPFKHAPIGATPHCYSVQLSLTYY